MKKTHSSLSLFYEKLGELFYAIAAVDKIVRKEEFKTLSDFVIKEWKDLDSSKDAFGADAVYQMEIVFDWFDYERRDAWECFESFQDFKNNNEELFTPERIKLINKTASAIANAFSGKNKSELTMLAKLDMLLKKNTRNKFQS